MDISHQNTPDITHSNLPARDELYQILIRNCPNGAMLLFDEELRFILAEGSSISEMGLSNLQSERKTLWEVFPAEICQILEPKCRAALVGEPSEFEVSYINRIYQVNSLPIRHDREQISLGMLMMQDIGKYRRKEERLVGAQQTYEQLINAIDGIFWEGNAQTFEYYFVSKQAERLLGYPVERWTNERNFWRDHIHPDDRDWAINFCALSTADKQDHVFEYRMIAADGRIVWLRDIVTVVIENDKPVKLLGVMVDISENKRIEADLYEREQQYRSIFESVSDALFINDLENGQLIDFNPAAARMHGYTVDEFRQLRPVDFIHPDSYNFFQEYIETVRSGGVFRGRAMDVRKNGNVFHVEVFGTSFLYKGQPHTLAVLHDIDEQVKSFQLLEQRIEERTRALQTLLETSRTVSSTLDPQALLGVVLDQLKSMVDYTGAAVFSLKDNKLFPQATRGPIADALLSQAWFISDNPIDHAIIQEQHPVVIDDVYGNTPTAVEFRKAVGDRLNQNYGLIRSWLGVPLIVKDQAIGIIVLDHAEPARYSQNQANLVMTFANHVAIAIENARLFHTIQRGADQFEAISKVGQRITSILDVDELLTQTVHLIQDTFNYFHVHIGLIEGNTIVFPATAGVYEHEPVCTYCASLHLKVGKEGICGWVAGTGTPLVVPDLSQDPRYIRPLGATGSGVVVPLKVKGQVIGVLDVESRQLNDFDDKDVAVLELLANQVAIAIENARLYKNTHELAALQERQKLARELHDSVSQALYGIGLGARAARKMLDLETMSSEDLVQPLEYVLSLAEAGLAEMRALIFELRPDSLENEGIVAAITKQAAAMEARHNIMVDANLGQEPSLTLEAKQTFYRIAQEAMNNIVKHANATKVDLRLTLDSEYASLEIQDDGIGFDSHVSYPGHLGLQSMRERAERLGGQLMIDSSPGRGSRVFAQLPISA